MFRMACNVIYLWKWSELLWPLYELWYAF